MARQEDGPRATKLHQLLEKSLNKTLNYISFEKLSLSFPHLARDSPVALVSAHQQICGFLKSGVQEEFIKILEAKAVIQRLNELDGLIDMARKGLSPMPSSNITPEVMIRARTVPPKLQEIQRLQTELAKIELQNQALMSDLVDKKTQLLSLSDTVRSTSDELSKAVQICSTIPLDEMRNLVETMTHTGVQVQ